MFPANLPLQPSSKSIIVAVVAILYATSALSAENNANISTIVLDQELWRTDPENEPFLRTVSKVVYDQESGEYFISDNRSNTISVISSGGSLLRSLYVQGDGPGKILSLVDFELAEDNRLALLSPIGPKITYITRAGYPVYDSLSEVPFFSGDQTMSNCYFFDFFNGIYVLAGEQSYRGRLFVSLFSEWGDILGDVLSLEIKSEPENLTYDDHDDFILKQQPWVLASNELVYIAPNRNGIGFYTIAAMNTAGVQQFEFTRQYSPKTRTTTDIQYIQAAIFGGAADYGLFRSLGWDIVVPDTDPDVVSIIEINKRLWVEHGNCSTTPHIRTYDVFDFEGHHIETVNIYSPKEKLNRDSLFLFQDTAVHVRGGFNASVFGLDESAPDLQIVCYSISYPKGTP